VSGPTHHCVEDLSIIRTLPNLDLYSPSDPVLATHLVDHALTVSRPKYFRLESKPLLSLYDKDVRVDVRFGFFELFKGDDICLVSTGFPIHRCVEIKKQLDKRGIKVGLVDVFALKPMDEGALFDVLSPYRHLISVEESFIRRGGLDALILSIFNDRDRSASLTPLGLKDAYLFENGNRDVMYERLGMDNASIINSIERAIGVRATPG